MAGGFIENSDDVGWGLVLLIYFDGAACGAEFAKGTYLFSTGFGSAFFKGFEKIPLKAGVYVFFKLSVWNSTGFIKGLSLFFSSVFNELKGD